MHHVEMHLISKKVPVPSFAHAVHHKGLHGPPLQVLQKYLANVTMTNGIDAALRLHTCTFTVILLSAPLRLFW